MKSLARANLLCGDDDDADGEEKPLVCFVNNEYEYEDIFLLEALTTPLLLRGQKRIDRFVVLFEEAETTRDAALRTPTLVAPRIIVLKMERFRGKRQTKNTSEKRTHQKMGPYSGSSLARFVRVGAVATGITYGFVVSGVWSLVRL